MDPKEDDRACQCFGFTSVVVASRGTARALRAGPGDFTLPFPHTEECDFLDCVKTRGQTLCDAECGHRLTTLVHLTLAAITCGRKLRWDPTKQEIVGDDAVQRLLRPKPLRSPWGDLGHCPRRHWLVGLAIVSTLCAQIPSRPPANTNPPPLYAFSFDQRDARLRSTDQQAELLAELGYAGAGHQGLDKLAERIQTLAARRLKLYQIYLKVSADSAEPGYDTRLTDLLPLLNGSGTQLALLIFEGPGQETDPDAHVIRLVREIADRAAVVGVHVVIYPHAGHRIARVEDALRIAEKSGRPNVGVMFNLSHWLRTSRDRNYRALLANVGPRLLAVSINGADDFDDQPTGWRRYIQPLGRGTFDVAAFLHALRNAGYAGPVGLQCYGLTGDARDHLAESMAAWQKYTRTELRPDDSGSSRATRRPSLEP